MKSIYAVMVQVLVVGSDYALFIVFARQLDPEAFVAFSTAVGLHILAWVIADGGVSYVAPRELATVANRRGGAMAGAFLTLRVGLYVVATVGGFLLWNLLAEDALDALAEANLSYRDRFFDPRVVAGDQDSFEDLDALFFAFPDLDVNLNLVTRLKMLYLGLTV